MIIFLIGQFLTIKTLSVYIALSQAKKTKRKDRYESSFLLPPFLLLLLLLALAIINLQQEYLSKKEV